MRARIEKLRGNQKITLQAHLHMDDDEIESWPCDPGTPMPNLPVAGLAIVVVMRQPFLKQNKLHDMLCYVLELGVVTSRFSAIDSLVTEMFTVFHSAPQKQRSPVVDSPDSQDSGCEIHLSPCRPNCLQKAGGNLAAKGGGDSRKCGEIK